MHAQIDYRDVLFSVVATTLQASSVMKCCSFLPFASVVKRTIVEEVDKLVIVMDSFSSLEEGGS